MKGSFCFRGSLPDNAETRLVDIHVTLENSAVQCEITSSKMHSRLCCSHRETSGASVAGDTGVQEAGECSAKEQRPERVHHGE